jgi:EAL domain-containing protein (putative c-di-GMP-specific phosphodiesterase class I)
MTMVMQLANPQRLHAATPDAVRAGLARDEIRLALQPIVELGGGAIAGFEALVRWEHPQRGTLSAAELLPQAETDRSLIELGAWVLERACGLAAAWPDGDTPLPIHVNLSGPELADPGLPFRLRRVLTQTGLAPERLCLEVSQALVLADLGRPRAALGALRELGVRCALDDVGADMPPLSVLGELGVDVVKVHPAVTSGIVRRPRDRALVAALVTYCGALGIDVIAEGVEDGRTAAALAQMGCAAGQGYHLMVPHPAELIGDLIAARRSRALPR